MAVRSTNTYQEGLQRLIQDVASMMLLPDSNPDFLFSLQNALIDESTQMNAPQQPPTQPTAGNAMPLNPAMSAPVGMPAGGPMPGSAPMPQSSIPTDELARMLQ